MEQSVTPEGKPRRNPFKSEQDAFRVVVYIVAAAVIIVVGALIATWLGVVLAIVALAAGLIQTTRWLAELLGEPDQRRSDEQGDGVEDGTPSRPKTDQTP